MQLHNLKRNTKRKKARQVGRGGVRGKTSGKGHKGQKARAGRKLRPEIRDQIKKVPKLRGRGKNLNKSFRGDTIAVNLSVIEKSFNDGERVSPQILKTKGLIRYRGRKMIPVKVLGSGELTKKVTVSNCLISSGAKEKIESLGGKVYV